jgi:hypothetical protein
VHLQQALLGRHVYISILNEQQMNVGQLSCDSDILGRYCQLAGGLPGAYHLLKCTITTNQNSHCAATGHGTHQWTSILNATPLHAAVADLMPAAASLGRSKQAELGLIQSAAIFICSDGCL